MNQTGDAPHFEGQAYIDALEKIDRIALSSW
jgi:hypothetical protein